MWKNRINNKIWKFEKFEKFKKKGLAIQVSFEWDNLPNPAEENRKHNYKSKILHRLVYHGQYFVRNKFDLKTLDLVAHQKNKKKEKETKI